MRTIEQIKETIAVDFMNNETVADMFGFPAGDNFAAHFSKVSIINILFYLFASAAWVLEQFKMAALLVELVPLKWATFAYNATQLI